MNPRDKSFVVILLATVGSLCLVSFLVYQWFWVPLRTHIAAIEKLEEENEQSLREWNQFAEGKAKLDLAKLKSLPKESDQATAEYSPYLEATLRDAGLQVTQFTPLAAVKVKAPASVPEIKEVGHRILSFNIKATGEEAALVSALDRLQKTPYEHRVKSLSVERVDKTYALTASQKLTIDMQIEVLLVSGTNNKMGLHAGIDPQFYLYNHIAARNGGAPAGWGLWASTLAVMVAAEADRRVAAKGAPEAERRRYGDIAKRNIFVGEIPIVKTTPPPPPDPPGGGEDENPGSKTVQPPEFVPAYVRLTTVVPSMQEAFLFNRIFGGREVKLMAKPGSGYDLFKITDEDRAYIFFLGKVLAVGNREIYFQVRDQVYEQKIGESLGQAMRRPLTVEQMFDLDLYELYDKEWAKEQVGDKKNKSDTNKKKKGGRGG